MRFVVTHMPDHDRRELTEAFVEEHVRLAHDAVDRAPWRGDVPREVFLNAVLPYANVTELRESYRRYFNEQFAPLVKDCTDPGQAAVILNNSIFERLGVQYHATRRAKPDQSPGETIASGVASCSGLSILLVDACRSVGVPARLVGTWRWSTGEGDAQGNHGGNHSWVEIWDGQQWRALGAIEKSELDDVWFAPNAARQLAARTHPTARFPQAFAIYAVHWGKTGQTFPVIWDPRVRWVNAQDVTADYAQRVRVAIEWDERAHALRLLDDQRLVAHTRRRSTTLALSRALNYRAQLLDAQENVIHESVLRVTGNTEVIRIIAPR